MKSTYAYIEWFIVASYHKFKIPLNSGRLNIISTFIMNVWFPMFSTFTWTAVQRSERGQDNIRSMPVLKILTGTTFVQV